MDTGMLEKRLEHMRGRLDDVGWRDPELLVRAAGVCVELGRREEAVGMLSRALEINRNHAYARSKLLQIATPRELAGIDLPPEPIRLTGNPLEPFAYPFRGGGGLILFAGGLFYGLLFVGLWFAMMFGWAFFVPALIVALIFMGYFAKYMEKVTCASAVGRKEMPDWPDFDPGHVGLVLKIGLLYLVTQIPALLASLAGGVVAEGNPLAATAAGFAASEIGMVFYPMMLMALFVRKSFFAALNPLVIFRGIAACGAQYWVMVAIWMVIFPVRAAINGVLGVIPFLGIVLSTAVSMYFFVVACRALGLVYQSRQEKLGWY